MYTTHKSDVCILWIPPVAFAFEFKKMNCVGTRARAMWRTREPPTSTSRGVDETSAFKYARARETQSRKRRFGTDGEWAGRLTCGRFSCGRWEEADEEGYGDFRPGMWSGTWSGTIKRPEQVSADYTAEFDRGSGTRLAIGSEDGTLSLFDTSKPLRGDDTFGYEPDKCSVHHANALFDVTWTCDDAFILTAGADRTVGMFDSSTLTTAKQFVGHEGNVRGVTAHPTNRNLLASCGRDGKILCYDVRGPRVVVDHMKPQEYGRFIGPYNFASYAHRRSNAKRKSELHSVTSVTYNNNGDAILSSGGSDGLVKLWDVRNLRSPVGAFEDANECEYVRGSFFDRGISQRFRGTADGSGKTRKTHRYRGISAIAKDPTSSRFVVSYIDNHMAMFDSNNVSSTFLNTQPIRHFVSREYDTSSYYIKPCFSPDGNYVACGSTNGRVFIWDVDHPMVAPTCLFVHDGGVSSVHWSRNNTLVTCSDDLTTRVWNIDPCDWPSLAHISLRGRNRFRNTDSDSEDTLIAQAEML